MSAGKRHSKKQPPTPAPVARVAATWPLVGTVWRGLLALGLVGLVMMGVVWIGGQTGRVVAPRDRYSVVFNDIEVPDPPSGDRVRFLTEVRYLDDLPERVSSVDPNLKPRLKVAFAKHPWVAAVDGVDVTPEGRIRVELRYRLPVLAVNVVNEPEPRLVDGDGIQLPGDAPTATLATLVTPQPPPKTPPGQYWVNDTVRFAATLAKTYRPRTIERTRFGFRLILSDGRVQPVLWDGG